MASNYPPETIYAFIVNDFERAWKAVAAHTSSVGRGNYMFCRQVMMLLEFAARLCAEDRSGIALPDLSQELAQLEAKYFVGLPGPCAAFAEFDLPHVISQDPRDQLLWCVFDLVRNGQAHQYQQIMVTLADGKNFRFGISGAAPSRSALERAKQDRTDHLAYYRDSSGDLGIRLRTEVLFADIKQAVTKSRLMQRGLTFMNLSRPSQRFSAPPRPRVPYYQFDSASVEAVLRTNGFRSIAPSDYIESL